MIKFETYSGSLYEVDDDTKQVRRLIGVKNPTPRQGKDGEWKKFTTHSQIVAGLSVCFIWHIESDILSQNMAEIAAKTTVTSPVKKVLDDEIS